LTTAVIARGKRAIQYSRVLMINRKAAEYWIVRSSRATTAVIVAK
jgi:hypothetical protein